MYSNILSNDEINYIKNLKIVLNSYNKIINSNLNKISFYIKLNDSLKKSLNNFGLNNLENINEVPMRWIKGDTEPHVDIDNLHSNFENTYLIYLTNNNGKIIIDNKENSIVENTGYIFNKGTMHGTINTGNEPRLIIGPMNEYIAPVGVIDYYDYDYEYIIEDFEEYKDSELMNDPDFSFTNPNLGQIYSTIS